jgi:hypothetical protein
MMGLKWMQAVSTAIAIAALTGAAGHAQEQQANSTGRAPVNLSSGQFDIGVGFYEALNNSTSGNTTQQTTTNAAGGMLEARYIDRPLVGFELTYAYNPANQTIGPGSDCVYDCNYAVTPLKAKANEVGLDWVFSRKFGAIRPFAVAGLGFFITAPDKSAYEVNTVVRPAFIGGGGVDWSFLPHLGLRAQFRDNVYKAPDLSPFFPPTGVYTQTKEPMGGIYFNL